MKLMLTLAIAAFLSACAAELPDRLKPKPSGITIEWRPRTICADVRQGVVWAATCEVTP